MKPRAASIRQTELNKGVSEVVKGEVFQERFLKGLKVLHLDKRLLNLSIQSFLTFAKIITA